MNKSLLFIKKRLNKNPDFTMPVGWQDNVNTYNPMDLYRQYFKQLSIEKNSFMADLESDQEKDMRMKVSVEYLPSSDFQYFACSEVTHDGTVLFYFENLCKLLNKFLTLGTFYSQGLPSDFLENPFKYDIKYCLGDVVVYMDFGKKTINGHETMGQKDTAFVPVKFECKLR